MMRQLRELDRSEWRVLGALRLIDATTRLPIQRGLAVHAPGAKLLRNASGLYVIQRWDTLVAHETEFAAAPAIPLPGSQTLALTVSDPSGDYLAVAAQIPLPRVSDPAQAGAPNSLFQPALVAMYPSASAPVGVNWAVLRVNLSEGAAGDALGGALLRVRSNGNVIARGLTDWRGEALVPVVGVPVTTFSDDENAVVITEISVTLEAAFDAATGTRTTAADVLAGHAPAALPVVNPATLESGFDALPRIQMALNIAARRSQSVSLVLNLP